MQRNTLAWFAIACALVGCSRDDDPDYSYMSPSTVDAAVDAGLQGADAGAVVEAGPIAPVDAGGGTLPGPDASTPPSMDASTSFDMDASMTDASATDASSDASRDGSAAVGEGGTAGDASADAAPIAIPGTAQACTGAPLIDVVKAGLPACELCSNARCLPIDLVTATNPDSVDKLAACGTGDNKCVPDAYAITRGQVKLKVCESLLGAEGRCMSECIPLVSAQGDRLPRDSCAEGERCAPCYDPSTGAETGACSLGCTAPPTEEPVTFEKCCSGIGSCVPRALAGAQASQLNPDTCSDKSGAMLCAPDDIATDKPATCRSINDSEGRCLARCLTTVQEQQDSLPQSSCPSTHLCVPCFDPRSTTAAATGACTLNGDAPKEPAKPFTACCGADGMCVPSANVPEAQRANLGQLTCKTGELCTPKAAVSNPAGGAFTGNVSCQTDISGVLGSLVGDGQAGICAPICFQPAAPEDPVIVGGQPLQGSCASTSQFCAPCVHPSEGTNTGACPPAP